MLFHNFILWKKDSLFSLNAAAFKEIAGAFSFFFRFLCTIYYLNSEYSLSQEPCHHTFPTCGTDGALTASHDEKDLLHAVMQDRYLLFCL